MSNSIASLLEAHEGRQDFPHHTCKGPFGINLQVTLDRRDTLKRVTFLQDPSFADSAYEFWKPFFAVAVRGLEGRMLVESVLYSWEDVLIDLQDVEGEEASELSDRIGDGEVPVHFLPNLMFRKIVTEYMGQSLELLEKVSPQEKVICRCFGITDGQLRRYHRDNPEKTMAEASMEMSFSTACGRCEDDCHAFFPASNVTSAEDIPVFGGRVAGMTPASLILRIHELLMNWCDGQEKLILTDISGVRIGYAFESEMNGEEVDKFREHVSSQLNLELQFVRREA